MDIHTWCSIPEAELARKSFFYMDDVSLEVIQEPPLVISTQLDEYYVGENIPWSVNAAATNGTLAVTLLSGERLIAEQTLPVTIDLLRGTFDTRGLKPDIYTLQAKISGPASQTSPSARRQVIVAPDPWPE